MTFCSSISFLLVTWRNLLANASPERPSLVDRSRRVLDDLLAFAFWSVMPRSLPRSLPLGGGCELEVGNGGCWLGVGDVKLGVGGT
jgi:hypothetical protein